MIPTDAPTHYEVALFMEGHGSTFAYRIAAAYLCADYDNRARLVAAFPDLFDRYRAGLVAQREGA